MHFKTYIDPDVLSFSWLPGPSAFQDLKPIAIEVVKNNGNGVLQVRNHFTLQKCIAG